jgi:hypothetical protein
MSVAGRIGNSITPANHAALPMKTIQKRQVKANAGMFRRLSRSPYCELEAGFLYYYEIFAAENLGA